VCATGESVSSEAAGRGEPRGAEIQTAVPEEGAGGGGVQTEAGGHHTAARQENRVKTSFSSYSAVVLMWPTRVRFRPTSAASFARL